MKTIKLLFVISDSDYKCTLREYWGIEEAVRRRSVEIELTDEQIKKIGLKMLTKYNDREIYESIESVSLLLK